MKEIVAVFIGGGLGSLARFGLSKWINGLYNIRFPLGTFIVNIIACFILGLVMGLSFHKQLISPTARLFWVMGFCGGFSTFSTFSNETLTLFQQGQTLTVIAYVLASVSLCVVAIFCGLLIVERI